MSVAHPTLGRLFGEWSVDPGLITILVTAAVLYGVGVSRIGVSRTDMSRVRGGWPLWRACSFLAGLGMLALALLSGVDSFSRELLSVHMLQHLLLGLIAPALLLCGAPVRLALGCSPPAARTTLARLLAHRVSVRMSSPAVGFVLFAGVILLTHLTSVYELALDNSAVHALEHAAYFWTGLVFLAPLIAADPLPHPPSALGRFAWLMGAMTVTAIPGVLLTFSTSVRYPFYLAPARALGRSALSDQHLAGVIMWVGGSVVMFALALTVAMQAMLAEERRQRRRELYLDRSGSGERQSPVGALGDR